MSEELSNPTPKRERLISFDASAASTLLDTGKFEQMVRVANLMFSTPMLPLHLRGVIKKNEPTEWYSDEEVKATCFLVVNQAIRWNFDPFAVMGETYVVGGKLAWQGKLVAAVVNARANLKAPLSYRFEGTKGRDDYTCYVSGTFEGETEPRVADLSVGAAKTSNSMWTKDPQQKLVYSAVVRWARRYCPEVVLGVMTDDDLERIRESERDVTPDRTQSPQERLKARLAEKAQSQPENAPESTPEAKGEILAAEPDIIIPPGPFNDIPEEQPQQVHDSEFEVDEVLTDFLLSIDEMTEAGELDRARLQALELDTPEKVDLAKDKIKKRAESLGLTWSSKAKGFITG